MIQRWHNSFFYALAYLVLIFGQKEKKKIRRLIMIFVFFFSFRRTILHEEQTSFWITLLVSCVEYSSRCFLNFWGNESSTWISLCYLSTRNQIFNLQQFQCVWCCWFLVRSFVIEKKKTFNQRFVLGLGLFVSQSYQNSLIPFLLFYENNRWFFSIGIITHLCWSIVGSAIKITVQLEGKYCSRFFFSSHFHPNRSNNIFQMVLCFKLHRSRHNVFGKSFEIIDFFTSFLFFFSIMLYVR